MEVSGAHMSTLPLFVSTVINYYFWI